MSSFLIFIILDKKNKWISMLGNLHLDREGILLFQCTTDYLFTDNVKLLQIKYWKWRVWYKDYHQVVPLEQGCQIHSIMFPTSFDKMGGRGQLVKHPAQGPRVWRPCARVKWKMLFSVFIFLIPSHSLSIRSRTLCYLSSLVDIFLCVSKIIQVCLKGNHQFSWMSCYLRPCLGSPLSHFIGG